MKAAVWYGRKDIRIENIKEPEIRPGFVKIKVKWCGICGSDLHEYIAGPITIPVDKPHSASGNKAPMVIGHEFSGEVVEIGEGVTKVKVGDKATGELMVPCGKCPACKNGDYNICESLALHGYPEGGAGFSEYLILPENRIYKLPDSMSYEMGALVEPMSVAVHSLKIGNFSIGQTAVVFGAGPIGLATIECLKVCGAKKVIAVQIKSVRSEFALRAGADIVLDPNETDIAAEIYKLTENVGADISFETTGTNICYEAALNVLKYHGTMVLTSIWENNTVYNSNLLVFRERKTLGTLCYCNDFDTTIALMADGRIKMDGYITKKIYLDDIEKEGFGVLIGKDKLSHVKILVTPDASLL
jgi:(R,R)-butanediol dehydrogenase/meso-butanediol dehydrogenase/diacetyl reductase